MSSKKSNNDKLPEGWVLCSSKSNPGRKYYFNKKTGKSSWTQPQSSSSPDKKMTKKEKHKLAERKKKEQASKKCCKRKSDGDADNSIKRKYPEPKEQRRESIFPKKEIPIEKPHTATSEKQSPQKCHDNSNYSKSTPTKSTDSSKKLKKNIANTRLSHLRARLSKEAENEEVTSPSPSKKKACTNESKSKCDKSPTNDSKLNQSPNNDSLHSIPSPSQFFAANKIISSMKAQLPEEYCNKDKQKDTFADIEKGICSQTPEYPFSKHPATPPQFSEASKLVSAIKSKLAYKVSTPKDTKTYTSAKDRMEALRANLSSDLESDTSFNKTNDSFFNSSDQIRSDRSCNSEAMDVEDFREVKENTPMRSQSNRDDSNVVLVVDTNIFIHELDTIKDVLNSHLKGYKEQPTLLVPWRVINELDRLKDNNNGNGAVCKRAKAAMDYLYKSLPENNRIKGQSLRDANSHIYPCEIPDDEILNCSLQQVERGKNVLLVTNDKNLCNKAQINGVRHMGVVSIVALLERQPQPAAAELHAAFLRVRDAVYPLLANILENEMRAKYDNLWQHVLFKAPPWTLDDVLQCLLKHWIAVFNEVFPRIEQLITDLRRSLISLQSKDPKTITQSEVTTFKELCIDVARRCQIIPEYMQLAKTCVERLLRDSCEEDNTDAVVDVFEDVWTVCSSYCAKLATSVGVTHNIEDKIPGEECLQTLTSKWSLFAGNIDAIAHAIYGVLSSDENSPSMEEALITLERAFREVLGSTGVNKTVGKQELRVFCTKCRNMLQEASSKFSQLSDLLAICNNRLSN
ncbi:transcriptional protein SWT1 [Colias croceus]|uniref:transcriptional protein SWT1 n=1 Tax=Colias crocea TaxID=72248 RepID=UPI001E27A5D1|nr:transcriptional protein SWT1 [Colias croceus]